MSIICQNCRNKLSCGCQKRTASNGAQVCSNCITSYESNLINVKNKPTSTILYAKATINKDDQSNPGGK